MEAAKQNVYQRPLTMTLLALACTAFWGSAATFIKLGYAAIGIAAQDSASQLLFAGCRFTLSGLMTLAFLTLVRRRFPLPKKDGAVKRVTALALSQTFLQYVCFYIGVAHTSGTNTAIINGCNAFVTILASALIFRAEKLNFYKSLGCILGIFAVVLMNLSGLSSGIRFTLAGEGLLFAAMFSGVLSTNFIKRFSQEDDPVILSGWQFTCGGLALIAAGLLMGGRITFADPSAFPILLYLAFVSAFSYGMWSVLLKYNPISRVTVFNSGNPIFGVFFAALLLGETEQATSPTTLIALVLVSCGIYIVNALGNRDTARAKKA